MGRSTLVRVGICLWIVNAAGHPAVREKSPPSRTVDAPLDRSRAQNVLAQTPLSFEENRGQAPPDVLYVARSATYGVSLRRDRVTLSIPDRQHANVANVANVDRPATDISIRLAGSQTPSRIEGLDTQRARSSYYKGQDPSRWITDVPHVARVRYESVYPGIDLLFYGSHRQLEFDFVVAPQASVENIGLDLDGVEALRIDPAGDLILQVAGGELVQRKPIAFQERHGDRINVDAQYVLGDDHRVRFEIGEYDHTQPLVIDPVFDNSSYIGGSGSDNVLAMAVDAFGQLHVAGYTQSADFPTSAGGAIGPRGSTDVFLMVFSTTNELLTSTVIGSSVADEVYAIAVDAAGASYLVGTTYGSGYPTTAGAFDETWNGGPDVFATKVGLNGQIVYSTYLGATGEDHGRGAALVPGTNELLIVGDTNSTDFPRTLGPAHQGFFDVFLVKLNASGTASGFQSRLIGGSSNDNVEGLAVRTAAFGSKIVITGDTRSTNFPTAADSYDVSFNGVEDVFVCEFSPSFTLLVTTFLGGSDEDKSRGVAVLDNDTFVTGYTLSNNFPGGGTRQGQDAFAARFGPNLNTLVYSRIFAGSASDVGYEIVAGHDPNGVNYNAYILGDTTSPDFFITFNGLDPFLGGSNDAFLIKLNGSGTTMYSSYVGGPNGDFGRAMALQGTTLWVGGTAGANFPMAGTPFDPTFNGNGDGFVARFSNFDDTNVTQQLLTLNRQGSGTVTSVPPGIDCGADCLQAYPNGRVVTLNATPANVSWTGCDRTTAASCVVTMNAPKTITASFTNQPVPTITSMTPGTGTTAGGTAVTIVGQNFSGATVTIGGAATKNLVVQPTQVTFLTPAHAAGGASVLITTSFGSTSRSFTYLAPQVRTITDAARPSFSFDGRWMAFDSSAALVDNDTNGLPDVFVRDRTTSKIVRVSVSSTGAQAIGGASRRPSISATGRFVAFESAATNLVPADTNQAIDVFVVDRDPDNNGVFDETTAGRTSRTFRVSLGPPTTAEPGGAQSLGGDSQAPSISGSGRWIAFDSSATNLVPNDTNQRRDVFVFDTVLGRTTRISVSTAGDQALNGDSTAADISLDGRTVAFQSAATNLVPGDTNNQADVFVRDRDVDQDAVFDEANAVATIRVSVPTGGIQAEGGPSTAPSISGNGRFVVFVSEATNLVAGDTNGTRDIFLRDRTLGTTRRMSLDPASGRQFAGAAYAPAISANGNTLIFSIASLATLGSPSAPGGVVSAAAGSGTDTGGTVTIPGPNQGNGPTDGTVDPAQNGETRGEPGVSGDGSTTGATSEQPSGGSDIDVVDNEPEETAGGNDPPYIAEITPPVGPPGGGGTAQLTGDNFDSGTVVHWGALDLNATVVDDAHALVQVPPGSGQVAVAVRSNGELSNDLPFTYSAGLSTPQITSVNPLTGSTEGGTLVTIIGTGFAPTNISVRFRGRVGAVQPGATATTLVVQTPAHVEGPAPIVLLNEDGGEATFAQPFTYTAPLPITPVITELLPSQGFREVTTVITVHGQARSFAPGTTATVDGLAAPVSYFNDKTIIVEAPPTPTNGNVPLVVNVPGGGSAQVNFFHFSVPNPFGGTVDTDGDGMTDAFEQAFGLSPNDPSDASADPDGDGLTNLQESVIKHHPVGLFTRYLSEGASNEFFETKVVIANPTTSSATILVHFQRDVVPPSEVTYFAVVPPMSRIHLDPAQTPINLPPGSFSSVIESNVEVVVDRTMYWDHSTHYGSHAETSLASPATTWYLAEGATNPLFELFYLLQNPDLTRTADVRVRYIRSAGDPIEIVYHVGPQSRQTIRVNGEHPNLAFADISAVITSDNGVPIIVERAMYAQFPGQRAFEAGHDSAGVTAAATEWFLAEGATGPFFEMFVLYANPNATDANVETTYLLPDGSTITKTLIVPANRRVTVPVAGEDARLVSATPSTRIRSTNGVPIIVERTMWWPAGGPWVEAHNSPGSTSTGTRWAVADGELSGPPFNTQTFLLVANPSTTAGKVRVTLLFEDGSAPLSRDFDVVAQSRRTIPMFADFPEASGRGFGALIESLADPVSGVAAPIVVERAMYSDTPERFWGAGTNVLATKLK